LEQLRSNRVSEQLAAASVINYETGSNQRFSALVSVKLVTTTERDFQTLSHSNGTGLQTYKHSLITYVKFKSEINVYVLRLLANIRLEFLILARVKTMIAKIEAVTGLTS
jgi:hypothetical protein